MMILNTTMDLIDAIFDRELQPRRHGGHGGVACHIAKGSDLEGLPKAGMQVESGNGGYLVSWPKVRWTSGVQEYVDTVLDPSASCDYWMGTDRAVRMDT